MVVRTLVSEHDYLHTAGEGPEPDYVDGEVIERTMPNYAHSKAQRRLMRWFSTLAQSAPVFESAEIRLQVAPQRYRVADLAVFFGKEPKDPVPELCPLVVAEIVSPDDFHQDIMTKLKDYAGIGVPHIWLINPGDQTIYTFEDRSLKCVLAFDLPELQASITAEQILG
mgnify:CR=1 FL=1